MPAVALEGLSYLQSLEKWKGSGDFSLDPIISVMNALGNPQDKPKCIHIGGTNGKGTLGASLSGLLTELGSPVGYYHSPTLGKLSEGFLVNGRPVSDRELSDAALKVRGAANTVGVSLSQFEALTASGFILFEDLEWSIIEVGLGGRLDSTNVINSPEVVVITSVGEDHQAMLGDTLGEIAREKAGIVKPGKKVVVGAMDDEPFSVIQDIAHEKGAQVIRPQSGTDRFYGSDSGCFISEEGLLLAITVAREAGIASPRLPELILNRYSWPGRLEVYHRVPELAGQARYTASTKDPLADFDGDLILDGAHNIPALKRLISFLESTGKQNLECVFNVFRDKSWKEMVELLSPYIVKWHIVEPPTDRCLDLNVLVEFLESGGHQATKYHSIERCFEQGHDLLVTGSFSVITTVRQELNRGV